MTPTRTNDSPTDHSILYRFVSIFLILLIIVGCVAVLFQLHKSYLLPSGSSIQVTRFTEEDLLNRTSLEPSSPKPPPSFIRSNIFLLMRLIVLLCDIVLNCLAGAMLAYLVLIPLAFRMCAAFRSKVLFLHSCSQKSVPKPSTYYDIDAFYLDNTDDMSTDDEVIQLGVWHIPPQVAYFPRSESSDTRFGDGRLVVMYAHGSGGNRGDARALYRMVTTKLAMHMITFDYRCFGDSTQVRPTADGIVSDTRTVYQWIIDQGVHPKRIILWGHSLGTAVITRLLSTLPDESCPLAAVLEAPFTSLQEEMDQYPLAKLFHLLPYFDYCFRQPIITNGDTNFDSLALLAKVRCPLLILHAEDDQVVPFEQGKRLFEAARKVQPKGMASQTKFISFDAEHQYGHCMILKYPNLHLIVKRFVREIKLTIKRFA